jgi:hypothetical protein
MISRIFLFLMFLAAAFPASGDDTPPPAGFAATVSAAKDVPAVAALLQEQLRRPLGLLLEIKDADSLTKAKTSLVEVTTNIDALAKRLLELPMLSSGERDALSKKMAASDKAHLKANQPALKAHLDTMPAALKEETMEAMRTFYKTVDDHKKIFEMYLKPDAKPGAKSPKPAPAKPDKPQ